MRASTEEEAEDVTPSYEVYGLFALVGLIALGVVGIILVLT